MTHFTELMNEVFADTGLGDLPQERQDAFRGMCFNFYVAGVKDANEADKKQEMHKLALDILHDVGELVAAQATQHEAGTATKQ